LSEGTSPSAEPAPEGLRRTLDPELLLSQLRGIVTGADRYPDASRIILEMVENAIKLVRDGTSRGDLRILNQALRELRYAFKIFAPYRRIRKVSVFGSARTPGARPEYEQARLFSNRMTRLGWMVITGAGGGIMEAAQGGAGRSRSFGVNIRLPFEQKANPYIALDAKLVNFKYFFTRKLIFVKETDGIALFPGGYGTHDEGFESLTLVQTGKSHLLPIVFIDRPGGSYWKDWKEYLTKHLAGEGYISPEDLSLFLVTDDVGRAVEHLSSFYRNYHSSRYVHSRLILRLQEGVSDELLDRLNVSFKDILTEGSIERVDIQPEEENEPETHHLHRLGLWFNRKSMGRLRLLVDELNGVS
jgi:uncharacterized protein (TIGR00730 family)